MKFIVITGGPGAGKTAFLELVRKISCEHIAFVPEAASLIFQGGFWRLPSDSAKKSAQRAIYHVQNEMEMLVRGENRWNIGLCDRGTLDGLAYWPGTSAEYFSSLGILKEKEYSKYTAVIHLTAPDLEHGYNHQNPLRIESADEALALDKKIQTVWQNHPNYHRISSTDNFFEKVEGALQILRPYLNSCCQGEVHKKAMAK